MREILVSDYMARQLTAPNLLTNEIWSAFQTGWTRASEGERFNGHYAWDACLQQAFNHGVIACTSVMHGLGIRGARGAANKGNVGAFGADDAGNTLAASVAGPAPAPERCSADDTLRAVLDAFERVDDNGTVDVTWLRCRAEVLRALDKLAKQTSTPSQERHRWLHLVEVSRKERSDGMTRYTYRATPQGFAVTPLKLVLEGVGGSVVEIQAHSQIILSSAEDKSPGVPLTAFAPDQNYALDAPSLAIGDAIDVTFQGREHVFFLQSAAIWAVQV